MQEDEIPGGALSLNLLTTQTMVTTGNLPLQGKIPTVEPGIEPGTSRLVVRDPDHQTTRLVRGHEYEVKHFQILKFFVFSNGERFILFPKYFMFVFFSAFLFYAETM